jgi:pilus assembly protein FimV
MRRTAALIILTGCLGALPWAAFGLGLGNIQLHSALGQKLDASIDLVGADQQTVAGLKVKLATPDQFKQAGVDDGQAILRALKFKVVQANGGWQVHVTSADPVREPFVTFLVDAQWPSGQVVREYTLLIDPPNYAGAATPAATAPAATASASAAVQGAPQAQSARNVAQQAAAPAVAASTTPVSRGDNYGPIRRGDTLWGISQRLRAGTDIGIDQMMIALYRANPDAFSGNINRMKAGYVLRVPDAAAIRNLDRREAIAAVREANRRYLAANAKPVAAPTPATTAAPAETAHLQLVAPTADDAKSDAVPGAEAGAAAAAVDQLKQQLAQAQQKADDAAAANAKLSGQVDNLKKQLTDTKRLLTVKDKQLSQLQAKVQAQTAASDNAPSASLVDRAIALVKTPLFLVGLLVVIVLIVGGGFVWRQRRSKAGEAAADGVVALPMEAESDAAESEGEEAEADDAAAPEELDAAGAVAADGTDDVLPAYDQPTGETSIDELLADPHEVADPVAEADFHIDYGLYDQAAEIIRKAIEADPARDELILKLFRIYAAAADAPAYASAAQEFADWGAEHPAEWDEICAKGRELVPGEPLFASGYLDPGATTMHATTTSTEIGLDTATDITGTDTSADALAEDIAASADPRDAALDFDLSGLGLDSDAPAAADPAPSGAAAPSAPEPAAAEGGIEFDLSPEAMGRPELLGGDRLVDTQTEFEDAIKELSEFVDTNLPASAAEKTDTDPGVAATPAGVATDTNADESDDFGGDFGADELDTKLDLARAYIDMGDPEGARAILQEVLEEGGAQHKEQAQSLLARVG